MGYILVTDDDAVVRKHLRLILEGAGYQVKEAADGNTTLKLWRQEPADIIILDLIMPEKEGIETLMELKQAVSDVKVIAISGGIKGQADVLLTVAGDLGALRTFKKPLDSAELLRAVKELLESENREVRSEK
ncbi:MAG: hypothetical protein BWK80_31240 [Desulfobacteraceae bacterium IS3]|nr:MAG: hypothetical protein BWK80_31240 [Desulfobacteraceae bacterium IS3]